MGNYVNYKIKRPLQKNISIAISNWEDWCIEDIIKKTYHHSRSECVRAALAAYLKKFKIVSKRIDLQRERLSPKTVNITQEMLIDLNEMANAVSRSRSEIVRFAIDSWILSVNEEYEQLNKIKEE